MTELLEWLYFFIADVQTGLGPFLPAYLSASGCCCVAVVEDSETRNLIPLSELSSEKAWE
jgi:hypothetical protein